MSNTEDVAGRVALVTGAGGNIGRAIAVWLAARGARLVAHGAPNMPAYSASKGAVVSLTARPRRIWRRTASGSTPSARGSSGPARCGTARSRCRRPLRGPYYADDATTVADQMIGQVPIRRYGSVEEVARVVHFLLSDDASYLTGSDLEIAGGAS